jgi:hypothetical protein
MRTRSGFLVELLRLQGQGRAGSNFSRWSVVYSATRSDPAKPARTDALDVAATVDAYVSGKRF